MKLLVIALLGLALAGCSGAGQPGPDFYVGVGVAAASAYFAAEAPSLSRAELEARRPIVDRIERQLDAAQQASAGYLASIDHELSTRPAQ